MTKPSLIFLHSLGASAKEWQFVIEHLPEYISLALDLPGFGSAAEAGHADVEAMADWLADEIRSRKLTSCVIVGHSMGGKIATIVAARAAAGEKGLSPIVGIVLVAASPPSPEPMDEDRRAEMISWFADGAITHHAAAKFVDANTAALLPSKLHEMAILDIKRSNREAWLAWLERGSREDWSDCAEQIAIPAIIVAGADDDDLGEEAQRKFNLPRYTNAEVHVVDGAAHLIPYEQPKALAALIDRHAVAMAPTRLPENFATLFSSDRVGRRTRAAMLKRVYPVAGNPVWTLDDRATVSALVAEILPCAGSDHSLNDRVLAGLAEGPGDGWRFASLPSDIEAWKRGIATLDAASGGFVELDSDARKALLHRIAKGEVGGSGGADQLSAEQMILWFEDVRAEIARVWISLPATMAAIGYDGFAVGGDGYRKQGYIRTGAGEPEAWQRAWEQRS